MKEDSRIAIFVATHVPFNPPANPIYIPLHVGRVDKEDLGYVGDHIGDNISDLNFLYGELTGLYWIWRNVSDIEYAGLCHYRRFFLGANSAPMTRNDYMELLGKYDVIVPKFASCQGSYMEHYGEAHNIEDLKAVERAVHKLYPEYDESFQKAMYGDKYLWGNLFVTSLSILKSYSEWLFSIFAECAEEIDVSSYDAYHRRVYGFLSEQMLYVYILKNNLSYCSVAVGVSDEKAETKLLKEQISTLLEQNRINEAKKLFDEALSERPDLLHQGSDIHSELNDLKKRVDLATEKKISIIIPCYNVEKYIDRCFWSLIKQTIGVEQLELIFVDDCSTDGTWNRLLELETLYPGSVMIIHCDENGRQGRARNIGLECATAPYIGFVDSDDWVEPDMFEKMYQKIVREECDIVMCRSWRDYDKPGQELAPRRTEGRDKILYVDTKDKRQLFLACGSIEFGVWNKLYRRELLMENNIFFPEKLAYEDHFFATLLYFYTKKVYIIEERLYHYFVNEQSTVLAPNATHHFDILTVDSLLWDECERRGFLKDYRQEMEYQFLSLCYLMSMKMMILRLPQVPYDFFIKLKEETLKRVPDYHSNPYVKELVTDLNKIVLELLDIDVTQAALDAFCNTLREYMKKGLLRI